MKKTGRMASVKEPHNYWINRRIYVDEDDVMYVKINYNFVSLNWMVAHKWEVKIY